MIPEYVDDGALRKQDQVELDGYLKATDRAEDWPAAAQPFFSGREAQINAFRTMLDVMSDGRRTNLAFVAHGAPGAGKSALLSQLVADMDALPTLGGKPWLPVEIPRSAAASPHAILRRGFGAFGVTLGPTPGVPDEGIMDVVAAKLGLTALQRTTTSPCTGL